MSKQIFTPEQMAMLKQNKNIAAVTEKSITYSSKFKLAAIECWQAGLPPSVIFREAGFDLALIGRKKPKWLLADWRKKFNKKGKAGLVKDNRGAHSPGRPPKPVFKSDKEKLKYLEAENAYLKAENAFLAKLRKQRLNYDHGRNSGSYDR